MPTAYVIQHERYIPVGMIGEAATSRGFDIELFRSSSESDAQLADPRGIDVIIVLGAKDSWMDLDQKPYLQREMKFIEEAINVGTPVLGICFGGQALALALGGTVSRSPRKEIGWFNVETANEDLVRPGPWFSWHEDQFETPPDVPLIAWTDVCHQAFRFGPHLGVQFHPEVTHQLTLEWEEALSSEDNVDAAAIIQETKVNEDGARVRAFELFDRFLEIGKRR